ncbi:SAF domain-containing protein [Actinomarinicola tropica]|uniref:SAF domain-containing protein n=1 Tax=Actinomarinicola tropica TaxID=2789776 RepID=UPI00189743ED|nr:SAF domain-containing protein [Actinomarinicola tropica]
MAPSPLPSRATLARRPRRRLVVALRRQPVVFWALAALAGIATYATVAGALQRATAGAEAYGDLVPVLVAREDLAAGATLDAGQVEVRRLPASLVPTDALASLPEGRSVRSPVLAGEAVAASRLAPDGAIGVAGQLAPTERAVAVPTDHHRPPLAVGQRVDVLATVDPTLATGRGPTTPVATSARVLVVEDAGITVAVGSDDAARLATAMATSVVTVVISPG